jgi:protein-tyrosine phosphatase
VQSFLERRDRAYSKVKELLEKRPELPAIKTGAEVYYFSGMGRAEQLPSLCIEGTDILLLELPFTQWHSDIANDIEEIMDRHRLRIVLAHLERYEAFQKDRHVWDRIVEMPLTIQLNCEDLINKGTFLRRNHRYKTSFNLLADHSDVIIGSDCHNLTERKPNLAEGREAIREKLGETRLEQLDKYTEQLLHG